jgi:O-palmitoleoyl-L-serine hydrolase
MGLGAAPNLLALRDVNTSLLRALPPHTILPAAQAMSRLVVFAAAAAAAATGVASAAAPNLATSILLSDAVVTHGARCLDGTPQRYWFRPAAPGSANASKWYLHIMGGGWCESLGDCASRAYDPSHCWIGSSRPDCLPGQAPGNGIPGVNFSTTMDFRDIPSCFTSRWCGGLMNNDPTTNPLTYDWNAVLLPYCDGGSFGGNNMSETTTVYNGVEVPLYFRGFRNLNAIVDDLKASSGLGSATELILSGDSAGGLATYWHADWLSAQLPSTAVYAAPDSGFFFSDPASGPGWTDALTWVVSQGNSTDGLNQACVQAQRAAGEDPLQCAFPEVAAAHVSTPLFVMNSRFDPALDSIVAGENGGNATNVNRLGQRLLDLVNATVLNRPGNAAFITSCHEHCGQWAQGQPNPFADFNVTIDGSQAIPALAQWMATRGGGGGARNLWVQEALYPCAQCCNGGQE